MADEVNLLGAVLVPQVHVYNVHGMLDFATRRRVSMLRQSLASEPDCFPILAVGLLAGREVRHV